jgi:hypothetical protein
MFKTGSWVGAGRWPDQEAHPDLWLKPLRGQVLEFCDTRAWANSIHFPEDNPHAGAVMGIALKLRAQGALVGLTPVLWDFGAYRRVLWEKVAALRPYEEELVVWRAARALRQDTLRHPRRRKPRSLRDFLPAPQRDLALA